MEGGSSKWAELELPQNDQRVVVSVGPANLTPPLSTLYKTHSLPIVLFFAKIFNSRHKALFYRKMK